MLALRRAATILAYAFVPVLLVLGSFALSLTEAPPPNHPKHSAYNPHLDRLSHSAWNPHLDSLSPRTYNVAKSSHGDGIEDGGRNGDRQPHPDGRLDTHSGAPDQF